MYMKIHTARKEHKCCLCDRKIPVGHRYWRQHDEDADNSGLGGDKEHTNCELYKKNINVSVSNNKH